MVQAALTNEQDKALLQAQLDKTVSTMRAINSPLAEKMAQTFQNVAANQDFSAFPDEAQASVAKIKALDSEISRIASEELVPATKNRNRTGTRYLMAVGATTLVATGLAAYFTRGMSLLPQAAIIGGSAIAGYAAGHLGMLPSVLKAHSDWADVLRKIIPLQNQIVIEKESLLSNGKEYADKAVSDMEAKTLYTGLAKTPVSYTAAEDANKSCGCPYKG